MLMISAATACTSLAATPGQFVVWRFLTGVALGFSVPNCAALTSEYAPLKSRALAMTLMNAAVGLGAFSAGFIAPPALAAWGWRGAFLLGGAAPLVIALLLLATVPESLKFLVTRRPGDPRIRAVLARIAPEIDAARVVPAAVSGVPLRRSVLELLSPAFRWRTLLMWTIVALNLFTLYVLISWLPTLLGKAGWAPSAALQGAVLIQAGGVAGGIGLSFLLDRGRTIPALLGAFLVTAASLLLFQTTGSHLVWIVLLLLVGGGVSGCQLSLNALSAAYYPPSIKATGVAWVGVIGGFGSMLGPLAGAAIIDRGFAPAHILAMLALPALLCAGCVLAMRKDWQAH